MQANSSIALFDSGLGGLSVLRNVRQLLPQHDLLYFADTAYCPYGPKPVTFVQERSIQIARWLVAQGARMIVVACNTASSAALELLRAELSVPIVGTEPGIKPAAAATRSGRVGVLATSNTLSGQRFAMPINDESRKVVQGVTDATKAANTATQAAEHAVDAAESVASVTDAPANGTASSVENGATFSPDTASYAQNGQSVARGRTRSESFGPKPPAGSAEQIPQSTHTDGHSSEGVATAELRMLAEQMQTMLRDMQSLQLTLRERGLLDNTWQPPSTTPPSADEVPELTTSIGTESEERPQ